MLIILKRYIEERKRESTSGNKETRMSYILYIEYFIMCYNSLYK
jgi:hypothetical protein